MSMMSPERRLRAPLFEFEDERKAVNWPALGACDEDCQVIIVIDKEIPICAPQPRYRCAFWCGREVRTYLLPETTEHGYRMCVSLCYTQLSLDWLGRMICLKCWHIITCLMLHYCGSFFQVLCVVAMNHANSLSAWRLKSSICCKMQVSSFPSALLGC